MTDDVPEKRIYVYFKTLGIKEDETYPYAIFRKIDGEGSEYVKGNACVSQGGIQLKYDTYQNRIFSFDYSSKYSLVSFQICPLGRYEDPWLETPLNYIDGSSFILDVDDYGKSNGSSKWAKISLNTKTFASYILSNIDPNSASEIDGYGAYPILKDAFYSSLTDYSSQYGESLIWNDPVMKRVVSFNEKWGMLKTRYEQHKVKNYNFNWLYYVGGGLVLTIPAGIVVGCIVKKKKHEGTAE